MLNLVEIFKKYCQIKLKKSPDHVELKSIFNSQHRFNTTIRQIEVEKSVCTQSLDTCTRVSLLRLIL